ncbi:MAG: hypothetical protein ABR991_00195 [Terracidiphilus sp.]|jgi:hypothetical protein
MNYGLSDQIRARAKARYVEPAILAGRRRFSIPVKGLMKELEAEGFPKNHARQFCKALTSDKFLCANGLEKEDIDGPPSKESPTVVVHYRLADTSMRSITQEDSPTGDGIDLARETPEAWAYRLTEKMRGLLKAELAEYGGGEAFLRWVRGYDEDEA